MDYPRMMYSDDGPSVVVHSQAEETGLGEGWSRDAAAKHYAKQSEHHVTVVTDPNAPPKSLEDSLFERLSARFEEKFKRGPGRPRKDDGNE